MSFDYLVDHTRAIEYLGKSLGDGSLVLILGAGVSTGAGLPDWQTLVTRLAQAAGIPASELRDSAEPEPLQRLADRVKRDLCQDDEKKFAELVRECLYRDVKLEISAVRTDLLTALGALMMGSKRGSIRRVVTYNFDCILEWYLYLHGFRAGVVLQPPQLEGSEDVRVYHPHGYLPHPDLADKASEFVILGIAEANLRLATPAEPWFEMVRHLLRTGIGLVVGMSLRSFRDRSIAPLLASVSEEVHDDRPTAFWLLNSNEAADTREAQAEEMLASNVVPLWYSDENTVPLLLLAVCRRAAALGVV